MAPMTQNSPEQSVEQPASMQVGDRVVVTCAFGDQAPPLAGTIVETEHNAYGTQRHAVQLDAGNGTWPCGTETHPYAFFFERELSPIDPDQAH